MRTLEPFHRGDTHSYRVSLVDANDQPLDITGWHMSSSLKLDPALPDDKAGAVVQITVDETDGKKGIANLTFTREQTHNLVPAYYFIDFQLTSPLGIRTTVLVAQVEVKADVSRGVV